MMRRGERGQVLMESVFAFSILMMVSLAMIEVSRAVLTWQAVAAAAHAGARRGAVLGTDAGFTMLEADAVIRSHVRSGHAAGLDERTLQLETEWPDGSNEPGMTVRVTVRQPFGAALPWMPVPHQFASTADLRILR